jgi:hypothetical protein
LFRKSSTMIREVGIAFQLNAVNTPPSMMPSSSSGAIVDARIHDSLRQFVEGFVTFAQASPASTV